MSKDLLKENIKENIKIFICFLRSQKFRFLQVVDPITVKSEISMLLCTDRQENWMASTISSLIWSKMARDLSESSFWINKSQTWRECC